MLLSYFFIYKFKSIFNVFTVYLFTSPTTSFAPAADIFASKSAFHLFFAKSRFWREDSNLTGKDVLFPLNRCKCPKTYFRNSQTLFPLSFIENSSQKMLLLHPKDVFLINKRNPPTSANISLH